MHPFFLAAGLLSFTLLLQYLLVLAQTKNKSDQQIARAFAKILTLRTATLLLAGFIPQVFGVPLALFGTIVSWIAPAFTGKYTKNHPIIFAHLLERLTLLTIITFGETIVGIAPFFTRKSFALSSILVFTIVATLFFTYITEFDHLVDETRFKETGNFLIYLHYPIIFGLSMVTVGLSFIANPAAHHLFAVSFLYAGIALMQLGIWLAKYYNQPRFHGNNYIGWVFMASTIIGYVASIIAPSFLLIALITAIATMISAAYLVHYLLKNSPKEVA